MGEALPAEPVTAAVACAAAVPATQPALALALAAASVAQPAAAVAQPAVAVAAAAVAAAIAAAAIAADDDDCQSQRLSSAESVRGFVLPCRQILRQARLRGQRRGLPLEQHERRLGSVQHEPSSAIRRPLLVLLQLQ